MQEKSTEKFRCYKIEGKQVVRFRNIEELLAVCHFYFKPSNIPCYFENRCKGTAFF